MVTKMRADKEEGTGEKERAGISSQVAKGYTSGVTDSGQEFAVDNI